MMHTIKIGWLLLVLPLVAAQPQSAKLSLTVEGLDAKGKGIVCFALFNSKESFLEADQAVAVASVKVAGTTVHYTFEDLPPGSYALSYFHDANENSSLDKNWLGIPKESYGFSQNAFRTFGPAYFEDAQFHLEEGKTTQLLLRPR